MTKTTIHNISSREAWLRCIIAGQVTDSSLKSHLTTMRKFCQLSIDGQFNAISLNSMKTNCKNLHIINSKLDNWEHFKNLTKAAHDTLAERVNTTRSTEDSQNKSLENKLRNSKFIANTCYLAFVELLQDITTFQKTSKISNARDAHILERLIAKGASQLNSLRASRVDQTPHLNLVKP